MKPLEPVYTVAILHEETLMRLALADMIRDMPAFKVLAEAGDVPGLKRAFALGDRRMPWC